MYVGGRRYATPSDALQRYLYVSTHHKPVRNQRHVCCLLVHTRHCPTCGARAFMGFAEQPTNQTSLNRPLLNVHSKPVTGTRVAERGACLLTFKCVHQWPVWSESSEIRTSLVSPSESTA
jgi:hypothetical protein